MVRRPPGAPILIAGFPFPAGQVEIVRERLEPLAVEIGRALRRARQRRGMTLRGVGAASNGRFMATSVAGYERGERNISLERFILLCQLYDVPPDRLLAEILRATEGRPEAQIDLTTLESLGSAEGALVSGFVRQVSSLRREPPTEAVSLRAGDVAALATASGRTAEELEEALAKAARR